MLYFGVSENIEQIAKIYRNTSKNFNFGIFQSEWEYSMKRPSDCHAPLPLRNSEKKKTK